MSKRPTFHLIQGSLTQVQPGTYRLRQRGAAAPESEDWPKAGEWRSLIHSLMWNPTNPIKRE